MAQYRVRACFLTTRDSLDSTVAALLPQTQEGFSVVIRRNDGLYLAMAYEDRPAVPDLTPGWKAADHVSCVLCMHHYRHGAIGFDAMGRAAVGLCRACKLGLDVVMPVWADLGGRR